MSVDSSQRDNIVQWLLEGDPAIRWQTLRDLVGASAKTIERERQRMAREGWGARLLKRQAASGVWAGGGKSLDSGMYTPKWTSTTYTMLQLRDFGLPPRNRQAKKACALLLERGLHADGGIAYGTWAKWTRKGETCITGMVLSILAYFQYHDARLDILADHLLANQMPDGGWNCRRPKGATHASMHTTISVLEALHFYQLHRGRNRRDIQLAQQRGQEFLLVHRLFRSHRTGSVIRPEFTLFSFPPRWHYDILRALDYFQAVGAKRDKRLSEAVELVRSRQQDDGSWPLQHAYNGKVYFEMERVGKPSRWNTLRALRVLKWWHGSA